MATSTRRQPVAQGGLFSTPKASFSKETQELLKGERAEWLVAKWVSSNVAMKQNSNISLSLLLHTNVSLYSDDARVQTDQLPAEEAEGEYVE